MKQALIIFVRNPVLGNVKTRLAKTAGAEKALEIYQSMLHHTHEITRALDCDKYVFYADEITDKDIWENELYIKLVQRGNDLGERMQYAFDDLFSKDYQGIAIIGSDNMELTTGIILQGFDALHHHDTVIGPSADGGYYLLGLTRMYTCLFQNMTWSTDKVLQETIRRCQDTELNFLLLPLLHDIDDEAGWQRYQTVTAAAKKLVFVYNADGDLFSTVTDFVHKLLSPSTYACSLCTLTHHHTRMKQEWKAFVQQLPFKVEFLHKDEFLTEYPAYEKMKLPAVFIKEKDRLQVMLSAEALNSFRDVDELKIALAHELKQHDLDHNTRL